MTESVICHRCGFEFVLNDETIKAITHEDLEVKYSECPQCGHKYHILTTDPEMRELIDRRAQIAGKYKLVKGKHFREEYYEKLERELAAVKKRQFEIYPRLKQLGVQLLKEEDKE